MFQAPQPMLPGWTPLQQPTTRLHGDGEVRRWLWPGTVLTAFATVTAYVVATSPGPGISDRGLVTLALAVIVLTVLTLRRRWGLRAVASTLAEYAVVAALAGLLVLAAPRPTAERPAGERQPRTEQASTLPPVIREAVGAWEWLAELWRRADAQADRRSSPPTTTTRPTSEGEAMAAPPHSFTPSTWRSQS